MDKNRVEWLIRMADRRELGPFTTSSILKLIRQGDLDGSEKIKRLPDGKWIAISREADFYDQLLLTLQEPKDNKDSKVEDQTFEETRIQTTPHFQIDKEDTKKIIVEPVPENISYNPPTYIQTGSIESSSVKRSRRKKRSSNRLLSIFGLLLFCAGGALIYLFLSLEDKSERNDSIFKVPMTVSSERLSDKEINIEVKKLIPLFESSRFNDLIRAQDGLIQILERAPLSSDTRGFLCLVHLSLSYFVTPDSRAISLMSGFSQRTKSIDPSGINSIYCELNRLSLTNESKKTRSLVEQSLNQSKFSETPVLFYFKAEALFEDFLAKEAVAYSNQVVKLWPNWKLGQIQNIKLNIEINNFLAAQNALDRLIQEEPLNITYQLLKAQNFFRSRKNKSEALEIFSKNLRLSENQQISPGLLAESHFYQTQLLLEKGDKDSAKVSLEKSIKLNPSNRRALEIWSELGGNKTAVLKGSRETDLLKLGERYLQNGNYLAAQAEFKTAFEVNPQNTIAAIKASQALWNLGQRAEAIEYGKQAVNTDLKMPAAYFNLAKLQSDQYNFKDAANTLALGSKNLGQHPEILRAYGYVESQRNNFQYAKDYYDRALKQNDADVDLLIESARVERKIGNLTEAQKKIIRAIELETLSVEAQVEYLNILYKLKGSNEAVMYIKDLINKFPSERDFRRALVEIELQAERFNDAKLNSEKLLEVEPRHKKNHMNYGLALQGLGLYNQAFKSFLQAAVLDPADAEPLVLAGLTNLLMNQPTSAMTQFQRAFNVNSDYPQIYYLLAKANFLAGNAEKAISLLGDEKKKNPLIVDSYLLAAEIYTSRSEFVKCTQEYQQAMKIKPMGADVYVKTARCFRQSGNPDVAENMLNIAAGLESGFPEIFKEQGALFQQRGDRRAAIQSYEKYLSLSPNAYDRQEILQLINSLAQ